MQSKLPQGLLAGLPTAVTNTAMCMQDPADKRFVLCDPLLKSLTGEDRFQAFGVQKYLKHHFVDS